jgi:hypothetical protein
MSSLVRRTPLRATAGVSKLADQTTCSRCHRPAAILHWCRQHAELEADRRVAAYVKRRDGACVACGEKRGLEWAHIYGRRYKRIQWNPKNSVALCMADHRYLDTHPARKRAFFRERFPGLLEELDRLKDQAPAPDLAAIITLYRGT